MDLKNMKLNFENITLRIGYNNVSFILFHFKIFINCQIFFSQSVKDLPYFAHYGTKNYGIEYLIVKTFAMYYNFSINLISCHNEYGSQLKNGTWTGMIAKIANNVKYCI